MNQPAPNAARADLLAPVAPSPAILIVILLLSRMAHLVEVYNGMANLVEVYNGMDGPR